MGIDLKNFLQSYIEESLEMLQLLEDILIDFEGDDKYSENISIILRTFHSLKSNSAAFNFNIISQLSHTIESFFEPIQDERQLVTPSIVKELLRVIDCIRHMLLSIQNHQPVDETYAKSLITVFTNFITASEKLKENPSILEQKAALFPESQKTSITKGWRILFHPEPGLLKENIEPLDLFNSLEELGVVEVQADISGLPPFPDFTFTDCYLKWEIQVQGDIELNTIKNIFFLAGTDANLKIIPLSELNNLSPSSPMELAAPPVPEKDQSLASHPRKETELGLRPTSIRISTKKVDSLLNLVGELVITKSILSQVSKDVYAAETFSRLSEGMLLLENNLRELRENVMQIRMLPLSVILSRCERLVHDLEERTGKKIQLLITGEQTELDKFIIEKITDPLLHLIRNAVDHGIELPSIREAQGKAPVGTIQIDTYQTGEKIYIEIKDDGIGLDVGTIREKALAKGLINENDKLSDQEIFHLIFKAGFSTAKTISDISGRGIGLDVVYNNLRELSGSINIHTSPGQGTTFQLCLPLTLAIFDCQLIKVDNRTYVVPVSNIIKISKYDPACLSVLDQTTKLYQIEGNYLPIVELSKIFSYQSNELCASPKYTMFFEANNQLYALPVDELLSIQQQAVVKNIADNYQKIRGISGVTVLGDGSVALILDSDEILDLAVSNVQEGKTSIDMTFREEISQAQNSPNKLLETGNAKHPVQFMSFLIADQEYGIPISDINELKVWDYINAIPNSPPYIKGIINLRGTIVPIMDLLERFSLGKCTCKDNTLTILLNIPREGRSRMFGIIADSISGIHTLKQGDIQPIPETNRSPLTNHIQGLIPIDNRMVSLLQVKNLMNC
ncbi:MAG: two-component system, chemotaxis family, sensor kinase CheA [Alphaproteobacteria bacterium]|jgi:two-component system chemotaxis sensor kinase CheA|nr:two-component system, chemotaxis family, sensor kinase CheA [Alphaproteobacteria bacterium]